MKEFIDKLNGRLEEKYIDCNKNMNLVKDEDGNEAGHVYDEYLNKSIAYENAIEIVNQLAEEYKDKVMINGQYCWQTCGATEHCKECNRLCNGSIDYYENYDFMAEEYNNGFCKWEADDKEIDVYYTKCGQSHIFIDRNPKENNHVFCPYCGKKIKVVE